MPRLFGKRLEKKSAANLQSHILPMCGIDGTVIRGHLNIKYWLLQEQPQQSQARHGFEVLMRYPISSNYLPSVPHILGLSVLYSQTRTLITGWPVNSVTIRNRYTP